MQDVIAANMAFSEELKTRIREVPAKLLHEAARTMFLGAVRGTVQDSGEAAASWGISLTKDDYVPGQKDNPVVGFSGEKRSQTGNTQPVQTLMTAEFYAHFRDYSSLIGQETIYITNPISGAHQINAHTVEAALYTKIDATQNIGAVMPEVLNVVT